VRTKLNHWTQGQRIPEVVAGVTGCCGAGRLLSLQA
jgi:hypothetical protein